MLYIDERKRVQDKLVLLTGKELAEVDRCIEDLIARRRRIADNVRDCE